MKVLQGNQTSKIQIYPTSASLNNKSKVNGKDISDCNERRCFHDRKSNCVCSTPRNAKA